MKILEDKYPKGTIPGQQTDGRYIDATLYSNLEVLAKKITDDMTFLGFIYSSTLEVGTGKSVLASQLGEAWTFLVNKIHKQDIPFSMNNCVFKPKDLIERSFKVPKYSMIWLDEWEDAHYWSELGITLRQFFRKCRQLNLFMICIIPNFFQLPINYAISRSVFAIDVKFEQGFQRGFFQFYNFDRKKELYIKGKKTQNYGTVRPNFIGRFTNGYAVNEQEYRAAKMRDMTDFDDKPKLSETQVLMKVQKRLLNNAHIKHPELSTKQLAEFYDVSLRTAQRYLENKNDEIEVEPRLMSRDSNYSHFNQEEILTNEQPT